MVDVLETGPENVDSGHETKSTESTPMSGTSQKTLGGADSRVRKRSKYLSYPYTNSELRRKSIPAESEESRTPIFALKAKASSRRISNPSKFTNASSGDLLSGLHSLAVGSMYPSEDKRFDMIEWFFCKYRISNYHDEAELASSLVNMNGGKTAGNDLGDVKNEKKRKKIITENAARHKMKLPEEAPPLKHFGNLTQQTRPVSMSGETPPVLQVVKQTLEVMASVLENLGHNLSPQKRAKLESEIKDLLEKVNSRFKV